MSNATTTPTTQGRTATPEQRAEWAACTTDPLYFVDRYCHVYDATAKAWVPFRLWPAQVHALDLLEARRLVVALKARQLGWSWLVLSYCLWELLFHPGTAATLFSKRDDEAVELLDVRLRGMVDRLPPWMRPGGKWAGHRWRLANGSRAMAFPTTGGRSYTASVAVIDEADFVPDLNALLNAVKPTVDAGGKLFLLSTADKSHPDSPFKRVYLAGKAGENGYTAVFHGWRARPDRTDDWYEAQRKEILSRTGALDDLHGEYPATDAEALAPRSLDKRIPAAWLLACLDQRPALDPPRGAPLIHGLRLYALPFPGRLYVLGADPAEGNPTSDPSACCLLDAETGEEAASFAGRHEPAVFAGYCAALARWFNRAGLLIERNNHGHTVLLWLRDNAPDLPRLKGLDGKEGWLSSSRGKSELYDRCAEAFREGDVAVRTFSTYLQLASVEGGTLRAPGGQHDDEADAMALGCAARALPKSQPYASRGGGTPPQVAPLPGGRGSGGQFPFR